MNKPKPKRTLKYTLWRKDRNGNWIPYARWKNIEIKMDCYTFDEVVDKIKILKEVWKGKQNIHSHGSETAKEITAFKVFYELWKKQKQKEVRPFTLEIYEHIAKKHILPFLGEKFLIEITRKDIIETIDRPFLNGTKRTAQDVHKILSNFFKFCLRENFLVKNPFFEIPKPKHDYKEIQTFDHDEAKEFLRLARASKYPLLFEIALITGMRPEEYFGLRWNNIDFSNNRIIVRKALNLQQPKTVVFHELKSKNSLRSIPVSGKLIERLKAHRQTQKSNEWNLVFTNSCGRPLEIKNIASRYFKPLVKKITEKKLSLYSLRHTCATLLLLAGENPKVVSERLGNTVEVTLKIYSHVLPNMQRSASEKLEKMLY